MEEEGLVETGLRGRSFSARGGCLLQLAIAQSPPPDDGDVPRRWVSRLSSDGATHHRGCGRGGGVGCPSPDQVTARSCPPPLSAAVRSHSREFFATPHFSCDTLVLGESLLATVSLSLSPSLSLALPCALLISPAGPSSSL